MFTKKPEVSASPEPSRAFSSPPPMTQTAPPPIQAMAAKGSKSGAGAVSMIGADLTVVGNLDSQGEIQIEGNVQGDVHATRIVVGAGATITGSLIADDVIVQGTVLGSVRGNRVTLQSNSKLEGDVFHQSLAIEQGAYFEGKSRRSDNPKDGAKPSGAATSLSNGVANGSYDADAAN